MLPAPSRMRNAEDFRRTVRRGVRAARPTLVVHAGDRSNAPTRPVAGSVRVGFVVSRAVGGAVRRNRVMRRLRHLVAGQLAHTPGGLDVVVRALPAASTEPSRVPADLTSAWSTAISRLAARSEPS